MPKIGKLEHTLNQKLNKFGRNDLEPSLKIVICSLMVFAIFSCNMVEKSVANDTVKQYEIAKKGGDKMQICVQAGLVSTAFLQAKDQENYLKWQEIKKVDCTSAGLPQ